MEALFYLAIIIALVIVIARINAKLGGIKILLKQVDQLNHQVTDLTRKLDKLQTPAPAEVRPMEKPVQEAQPAHEPVLQKPTERPPLPVKKVEPPVQPRPMQEEPIHKPVLPAAEKTPASPPAPEESWFDKWIRNNPDIEKFIGENLVNKIGIAVLVLGIAFFVKYAIDQDWINEIGRVCIGMLCGSILIGFAHRLRKNYQAFSSVLCGGGLAVFYFTIAFAFHQYHLFSQEIAFVIMVIITAFAVTLAILYNRLEIAILAAAGGFLTPFLVSTGKGNYVVLFTYLCILNAGLIVLAFHKKWRVLNFIAFVFTMLIYGGWIFGKEGSPEFSYSGTFVFGTVFYLMFLVMNIVHHTRRSSKLNGFDLSMLLAINLGYYSAGIFLLTHLHPELKGLFTAILGIINLLLAYMFYKRDNIDKNFVFLLIGLTLSYLSLAAPVQLSGNHITLFWSAEAVILFWLFQKSRIGLLKLASALITLLIIISLMMDWSQVYSTGSGHLLPVIINKGFITTLVAAIAMGFIVFLLKAEADTFYFKRITSQVIRSIYTALATGLFFMTGLLETGYQFTARFPGTGLEYVWLQCYTFAFVTILLLLLPRLKIKTGNEVRLGISALLLLCYLVNIPNVDYTEKQLLTNGNYQGWFSGQWLSIMLVLAFAYQTIQYVRADKLMRASMIKTFSWVMTIAVIIVLSVELKHIYVWLMYSNAASVSYAENLFSKAGLSIVWGLSSFALIWLGLRHHFKPLRIIALLLFGITLVKLFAFDIRNIPAGGKIAAFILLGVLLLIISFMYQRLKKIIIDDRTPS